MRFLAVSLLAVLLLAAGCKPARSLYVEGRYHDHTDPYPAYEIDSWTCMAGRMDVVETSVEPSREGDTPLKTVHVSGYTEMPDASDVVVALRPLGSLNYLTWADVVAADHRFHAHLGPFTNLQLPQGTYVVEVMWLTHRQHPVVREHADVQDSNMAHRMRDMDTDHRSSKVFHVPTVDLAQVPAQEAPAAEGQAPAEVAPKAEHPAGEHPAGEHPAGEHPNPK